MASTTQDAPKKGTKAHRIAAERTAWSRLREIAETADDQEAITEADANLRRLDAESAGPRIWEAIPEADLAKIAKMARPAESPCICGCGGTTKGRFVPGHDAVLKERLKATKTPAAEAVLRQMGW